MQRRLGSNGTGTWSVPGGHLENGESWERAAMREVMEETGVRIDTPTVLAFTNDIFPSGDMHYVSIWLSANWLEGEPYITEPDRCTAQAWHTFNDLPVPLFEPFWQNLLTVRPDLFRSPSKH